MSSSRTIELTVNGERREVAVEPRLSLADCVRARLGQEPVWVESGRVVATTFHPELTRDVRVHQRFVELAREFAETGAARTPKSSHDASESRAEERNCSQSRRNRLS